MKRKLQQQAARWLWRNRAKFPDGFTVRALRDLDDWETAKFRGLVRLKKPRVAIGAKTPEGKIIEVTEERLKELEPHGVRRAYTHITHSEKIHEPRPCGADYDPLPGALRFGGGGALRALWKAGTLQRERGTNRRFRYRFVRLERGK